MEEGVFFLHGSILFVSNNQGSPCVAAIRQRLGLSATNLMVIIVQELPNHSFFEKWVSLI